MSRIILTGATGNAGSGILSAALSSPDVASVTLLTRREPPVTHPKLKSIIVPSDKYPEGYTTCPSKLLDEVKGHTAIIWAQGISQTQVDKDEYFKITHDYPLAFARGLSALGTPSQPFKFILVSGEGVDQSETGRQLFSRVKGKTEKELQALESDGFKVVSVRPGAIAPSAEHRQHMGFFAANLYRWGSVAINTVLPSMVIQSTDLGKACVSLATSDKHWGLREVQGWMPNTTLQRIVREAGSTWH